MSEIKNKTDLAKFLSKKPVSCNVDCAEFNSSGLYDIEVDNSIFNCFFYKRNSSKLYVILSAIGLDDTEYPYFTRITWPIWMSGNAICIDDPTRRDHKIAPAFFMGSAQDPILDKLHKLIESIRLKLGIDEKNVVFISSSNGGYASIQLANKILGSKVIAYNPQFSPVLYFKQHPDKFQSFTERTGISFGPEFESKQFDFLENKKSKFVIYINLASRDDRQQLELLKSFTKFQESDLTKKGFYKITENFHLALVDLKFKNPHIVQPNLDCTKVFEQFIFNNIDSEFIEPLFNLICTSLRFDFPE